MAKALSGAQQDKLSSIQYNGVLPDGSYDPVHSGGYSRQAYGGKTIAFDGSFDGSFNPSGKNPWGWTAEFAQTNFSARIAAGDIVMLGDDGGIIGSVATSPDIRPTVPTVLLSSAVPPASAATAATPAADAARAIAAMPMIPSATPTQPMLGTVLPVTLTGVQVPDSTPTLLGPGNAGVQIDVMRAGGIQFSPPVLPATMPVSTTDASTVASRVGAISPTSSSTPAATSPIQAPATATPPSGLAAVPKWAWAVLAGLALAHFL